MDDITNIKARLPIEQLVAQYCQLQKKGRSFVCLCPFHNDSKPSLLVSPDKGIAYCFACQTGGDIFSFYQAIEGVDFPQALKELAEKAGVTLEKRAGPAGPKKDEKERARECLLSALAFYRHHLGGSAKAAAYLAKRAVPQEQIEQFEIGVAPESYTATYDHLLKQGFSRKEIIAAGLGIQKELREERIYDRFRNRLMFPIHDAQGVIAGFGGRTLADDDAKYINSSDGIVFHKSKMLFGLHHAKEKIRDTKAVVIVEGYFDVLACHRVGATNAVATCGTALTEDHVALLRRYADRVILCLDQDRAGQDAMERAFPLLAAEGLQVDAVVLPGKDPSETLEKDPELLKSLLETGATPYLDAVLAQTRGLDLTAPAVKREALQRLLRLINALPSVVERGDYIEKAGAVFGKSSTDISQELQLVMADAAPIGKPKASVPAQRKTEEFSSVEIALGIFLFYPKLLALLSELIPPPDGMAAALHQALSKPIEAGARITPDMLDLPDEHRERAGILALYCEHHGFTEWSDSLASREIRRNCVSANREMLRLKQQEITRRLVEARGSGKVSEEAQLQNQYQQLLKLMQKAG